MDDYCDFFPSLKVSEQIKKITCKGGREGLSTDPNSFAPTVSSLLTPPLPQWGQMPMAYKGHVIPSYPHGLIWREGVASDGLGKTGPSSWCPNPIRAIPNFLLGAQGLWENRRIELWLSGSCPQPSPWHQKKILWVHARCHFALMVQLLIQVYLLVWKIEQPRPACVSHASP